MRQALQLSTLVTQPDGCLSDGDDANGEELDCGKPSDHVGCFAELSEMLTIPIRYGIVIMQKRRG
jgi:hypothetical protein